VTSLVLTVAELLRRPSSRRSIHVSVPADGMSVLDAHVPDGAPVDADLELESLPDGIVVTGTVSAPWEGQCRRCLGPVRGELAVAVRELFQVTPIVEDARPIEGEQVDLEPVVREAVMLELPLAPLCREDCAGLRPECGVGRNGVDCGHGDRPADPRWAALDQLRHPPSN
jgi:uncharacterized protein